jgi:hypothetical protein
MSHPSSTVALLAILLAFAWSTPARVARSGVPGQSTPAAPILFGGPADEDGVAVVPAGGGGWFLVANTTSYGAGANDVWVVKLRADYSQEWDRTFGTAAEERAWNAVSDGHGGLLIAGHTGTADPGTGDLLFIRVDDRGTVLWDRTYDLPGRQGRGYVQRVGVEGYVLSGWTTPADGSTDFLLLRTDAAGGLLWQRTYGGDGQNGANAVRVLPDGGFALYGEGRWSGDDDYSTWQGILVRTDPRGIERWHREFGRSGAEEGYSLALLPDGGFLVGGFSNSEGRPGAYGLKCDPDGSELWWRRYPSPMVLFQIEPVADGYLTVGPGGVRKIDEQGETLWSRVYPDLRDLRALAVRPDGGLLLMGTVTDGGAGGRDVALLPTDGEGNPLPHPPCPAPALR